MICNEERCMDGHNEDGGYVNHEMFAAFVRMGRSNYTTWNYVGDLLGGMSSFAFNAHGIAFSLNYVSPKSCDLDGLGRNFVSRLLLDARTWDEAVNVIGMKHAAGHNYQLMDFANRRIANFEAASDLYSCREIGKEAYYHANQYTTLNVPGQHYDNSSIHRMKRVSELPKPKTREDILKILGDQADHSYPIFHDKYSHEHGDLSDWTLSTAFFDLDNGTISVMDGNPARLVVSRTFHVPRRPITLV